ncbi:MAG: hydroxymethylbilane synthase [Candidatus Sericytochromatia bacterium]|nr:hydroxymethylbilane synthase [Candidatus Sericytochromatia bacterium]
MKTIKIGTRGSKLALWQANYIQGLLTNENPEFSFEIVVIKTKGDKILDIALSKIGDKGLFTKELEIALLNNEVDLVVHSMKDVPTTIEDLLCISSMPEREQTFDIFISNKSDTFAQLPSGSRVGTSSLRRKSQLLYARKDLEFIDIRGNVDTRLKKLDNDEYDAIILAYAGIYRLGWSERIKEKLDFSLCLPAVGQGAVGIQIRKNDQYIESLTKKINHLKTYFAVNTERAFLHKLEGGCQVPIGCQAYFTDNSFIIDGIVADVDGQEVLKHSINSPFIYRDLLLLDRQEQELKAIQFGEQLADIMLSHGAKNIIAKIR